MTLPFQYDHHELLVFGGEEAESSQFETARAAILPIPLERTTSYMQGTKNGPREILHASSQLEFWDEELEIDVSSMGLCSLPGMKLPQDDMQAALDEITNVASAILQKEKFFVGLGGEHSITPALVAASTAHHPDLSILQIDAHADLRESYMGSRLSHACAMRRSLEYAKCTQVGIRSMSQEESEIVSSLNTTIFFDINMRQRTNWISDVVKSLGQHVYITIDCDGLEPGLMPAVGTPEPGGLSWRELLGLLRAVFSQREVIACDVVELCPIPGVIHPNFLCAKLVYKLLTYKFAQLE
jgi:agmatinase